MTAELFLGFLTMMVVIVVAVIARYVDRRTAFGVLATLSV
jgi:hypothetical protein